MGQIKIGISMGDPAGIGPEIIAKAVVNKQINRLAKLFVVGDRWVFERSRKGKARLPNLEFIDLNNVSHKNFKFGKIRVEYGRASIEYLKKSIGLIKAKKIDCLVTAPISKQAINLAGYKYSGHTEFLARAFGRDKQDLVMMLFNKYLKISLATRHLALSKVSPALSREIIYKTIILTYRALLSYFAVKQPRICVAALNPHAGEQGLLGKEEIRVIAPAIRRAGRLINPAPARRGGVKDISGPLPADTAFSLASQGRFDAVVAMYHDQALIPLKLLDFASGVNLTLGLDVVRTSPLHGTGFDIAGRGIADSSSMAAAIKTAVECTRNLRKARQNLS
jgi:4-hydroxythreonine-4-phosphate dehydrogenase